jgi:hypothetical protein
MVKEVDMTNSFTGPKVSDWSEATYSAGINGINLLAHFEKEIHRVYPGTNKYKFGFFSADGAEEASTAGWVFLKGAMFEVEDWNSAVGLRFGLTRNPDDNIKHRENFLMIMPMAFREDVLYPAQKRNMDRLDEAAEDAQAFVHPSDPEFNKMKDRARELSSSEKFDLRPQMGAEPDRGAPPPKKAGRPKGSKNKSKAA